MSDAVDISREAVEHLASELTAGCAALDEHGEQHLDPLTAPVAVDPMVLLHASAMIRALRAALDAALEELRETVDARQRALTTLRLQEACWARTRAKRAAAEAERDRLRAEVAELKSLPKVRRRKLEDEELAALRLPESPHE